MEFHSQIRKYISKHNLEHVDDLAKFVSQSEANNFTDVDAGETLDIPLRDGSASQIRIFQSMNASAKKPLVVMIHGGG